MKKIDRLRALALSFPETTEEPHFDKTSFRVRNKIFATYYITTEIIVVKLSLIDQNVFSSSPDNSIYPLPNKWGKQGWTKIELAKIHPNLLTDVITTAYCTVAPVKLAKLLRL
jgi:hypothetical protein